MKQYTNTHEWVELLDGKAYVGISAHAAEELGEVVYVDLPSVGAAVTAGEPCCELESVKAVAESFSERFRKMLLRMYQRRFGPVIPITDSTVFRSLNFPIQSCLLLTCRSDT